MLKDRIVWVKSVVAAKSTRWGEDRGDEEDRNFLGKPPPVPPNLHQIFGEDCRGDKNGGHLWGGQPTISRHLRNGDRPQSILWIKVVTQGTSRKGQTSNNIIYCCSSACLRNDSVNKGNSKKGQMLCKSYKDIANN